MRQSKKITAFLLVLLMMSLFLASCKTNENQQGGSVNNNGSVIPTENVIFSVDEQPNIICNNYEEIEDALETIQMGVYQTTYYTPSVYGDEKSQIAHEIVVGKSERDVSETAYRYLERVSREDGEVAYLIYSDGSSVAIAYDEDRYRINSALYRAVELLDEEFFTGEEAVTMPKGVYAYFSFDALEYQKAIDEENEAKQWIKFEEAATKAGGDGAAITAAVKEYYELVCTDNVISWFANLYDPAVGGYYFSNSARNTPGFLPDIESTQQAIGQINASGMLDYVEYEKTDAPGDASYIAGLPEWFRTQVIRFLKSLQDPETGYYYHPQWTKAEVNQHLSRRARDLNRAVGILQMFGSNPTYDTPNKDKGDGIKWDEYVPESEKSDVIPTSAYLTGRLIYGSTTTLAVSKVVPTAEAATPSHLLSVSAFKAYLDEQFALNAAGKRSFYSIGNEIGSQESQILAAEKKLDPSGNTHPLGDVLIAWYSEHQNKETGLWDDGLSYDNTNAILKIGGTYTTFGHQFPNADKAFESCVELLTTDEVPDAIVEVYNVWYAISNLMINVNKFATTQADRDYAKEVRANLLKMAPEAIRLSAEKQLLFKHRDGSFGYTVGSNCVTSQGMRVAPPGNGEGDVNASTIAMSGTINNCLKALGLDGYQPGYFSEAERLRYVAILEDLGPVIKDDVNVSVSYETFDFENPGNAPLNVTMSTQANGHILVVQKEKAESGDNAMEFVTYAGAYESLKLYSQSGALNSSCFVFETDMMIKSALKNSTVAQILMQSGVYMINIQTDGNTIKLVEASSTTGKNAIYQELYNGIKLGQWFNLKIKYYPGDHNTVRIKVYLNNNLIAVTDNYYDSEGIKLTAEGNPASNMDFVNINGISSSTAVMQFDNMACYKTTEIYKPVPANSPQPPINIDPPDRDPIIYDFADGTVPEDFVVKEYAGSVKSEIVDGNGVLKVTGANTTTSRAPHISVPINTLFGGASCVVFDAKITVAEGASGIVQRFWFTEVDETQNAVACFDLAVNKDGKLVLCEAADGKKGNAIEGVELNFDEEFNLRLEYYEEEKTTVVYLGGEIVGVSGAVCTNADKYKVQRLIMTSIPGVEYNVTYDNIVFEKDTLDLNTQTSSGVDRNSYKFEDNKIPSDLVVSESGVSASGGELNISGSGSFVKIPLTDRNVITTAANLTATINADANQASYVVTFADASGKEIISVMVAVSSENADSKKVDIYEYYITGKDGDKYVTGKGNIIGSAAIRTDKFTIDFRYFFKASVMNVYIGTTAVATTSLTHLYDRDALIPTHVVVKNESASGTIKIDECYAERNANIYFPVDVAALTTPAVENPITFETSSLGSYPKAITISIGSNSSAAIKAMINKNTASKMLKLTTAPGSNDSVKIELQESNKVKNPTAVVFEADLLIDSKAGTTSNGFQIFLRDSSDTNAALYTIYADEGKTVKISDYNGTKGEGGEHPLTVNEGELFNLRIEYTVNSGVLKATFFVNGKEAFISTVYTPADAPINHPDITRAMIYSLGATDGSVYIDNLNFSQK